MNIQQQLRVCFPVPSAAKVEVGGAEGVGGGGDGGGGGGSCGESR